MINQQVPNVVNDELNMDIEYNSNVQNEESPLLVAQRYLNIFHQIHIFNNAKKEEFDQSLLEMPVKIKKIVADLPGGRLLLEHIDEVAEKYGLAQDSKEYIKNRKIGESSDNETQDNAAFSFNRDFAHELAVSLAAALKSNNIGSTPSEEQIYAAGNGLQGIAGQESSLAPQNSSTNATLTEITPNRVLQKIAVVRPVPKSQVIKTSGAAANPASTSQTAPAKSNAASSTPTQRSGSPLFSDAIRNIRQAINSDAHVSLDDINVKPVSLSLHDATQNSDDEWVYVDEKGNPVNDDSWVYVDENGNPIEGGDWEYVDEHGNPVSLK